MAYSDKYSLPIKSVDYFDLDVNDKEGYGCKVEYLDGTEKYLTKEDELAQVREQLTDQLAALEAGESLKVVPQYTEREQEMLVLLMQLSEAAGELNYQINILDRALAEQYATGYQKGVETGLAVPDTLGGEITGNRRPNRWGGYHDSDFVLG